MASAVVGLVLLVGVVMALASSGGSSGRARKVGDDSTRPVTIRVEAELTTCWTVTLTSTASNGGPDQSSHEGCGNGSYALGSGIGRNASVLRKVNRARPLDHSPLTAVLIVDGKEKSRQTTTDALGYVILTP